MKPIQLLVIGLILITLTFSSDSKCGYNSCEDLSDDYIHVHLVPHTHDDVGWLKNVDEYYYGDQENIQRADVRYIITNVVDELLKDEKRRFIYVEMAFFTRWFLEQTDERKADVRQLVNEGRLVFTNGGWSMNDEAATHYNAIVDQMTIGLRTLKDYFGDCGAPKVAWHIDPFGHSKEQANLFSMMGFDGFFFARIDYDDFNDRKATKRMEELWHGGNADLLFGVLYYFYGPPPGFCFDAVGCSDTPIKDVPYLEGYNVDERVNDFINVVNEQAQYYRTNHIMFTMGMDFQYGAAAKWFINMDKVIQHVNARQSNGSKINVLYSSPMCYTYALNKANITWTTKSDDFFPYASDAHSYWTGYYTSRPAQKGYIRQMNNLVQVGKQLAALKFAVQSFTDGNSVLQEAMGINQHHDAVTGTEKQAVQDDYCKRLYRGMEATHKSISETLALTDFDFCPYRNISICPASENSDTFQIVVYNPIARDVSYYVRMPVRSTEFSVTDSEGQPIEGVVFPVAGSLYNVRRTRGDAPYELTFEAHLDGLSSRTYTVTKSVNHPRKMISTKQARSEQIPKSIENQFYEIVFYSETNSMFVTEKSTGKSVNVSQGFSWYHASKGEGAEPASGAYCFRPESQIPISLNDDLKYDFQHSNNIQELRVNFSANWTSEVIRLYDDKEYIEIEWIVGPIPVDDGIAKEVIIQYNTDMNNNETYYTDANGRQILKRIKNYRPTWTLQSTEPVSQNYYPINSRAYIQDVEKSVQLTVLTDRSEGGASINNGQLEIMLHRRDLADDGFGVGEALNEPGQFGDGLMIRGVHRFIVSDIANAAKKHRLLAEEIFMAPIVVFDIGATGIPENAWNVTLPENVHLLTLEQIDFGNTDLLIRLENQFAENEDPDLSKTVTVDLQEVFDGIFTFTSIREMTLGGNQWADEASRLQWLSTDGPSKDPDWASDGYKVTLAPMEIKTYTVTVDVAGEM